MNAPHPLPDVERSLERALRWMNERQLRDGHFDGATWSGPSATAQTVIVESLLGVLSDDDRAGAVRLFEAHTRADGSIEAWHGAEVGSLVETAQVEAALGCCGLADAAPQRMRMRAYIEAHGGRAQVDPVTKMFLVMAGALPATSLPKAPLAQVLAPGLDAWIARTFLVHYGMMLFYLVPGLSRGLRRRAGAARGDALDAAAERRVIEVLLSRQNPDGNWVGGQWVSCMALACLHLLGDAREGDAIRRGLAALQRCKVRSDDGLRVVPYNADVWNTAVALRALTTVAHDAMRPEMRLAAVDYLLAAQCDTEAPRAWSNLRHGQDARGGWSFSSANPLLSDTDTTAVVMWTLKSHEHGRPDVTRALHRGLRWLRGMQNDDGGFAAFARGQRGKPPGPLFQRVIGPPRGLAETVRFFAEPPLELVDHATVDLTARVLSALGALGARHDDDEVARATAFLDAQREGDAWWGRWTTNYIACTAFVLDGLHAVGRSQSTAAEGGRRWLLARQNRDGGFGERNASYANPSLRGRGPSNGYVTGLALNALLTTLPPSHPSVMRAVAYLVESQSSDGAWVEREAVQTLVPPEFFYVNTLNFQTAPIEALGRWRRSAEGAS